jgi:hypothetical protein
MENFDVIAAVGNLAAHYVTFANVVTNASVPNITIIFTACAENPQVSGVEIFFSATPSPTSGTGARTRCPDDSSSWLRRAQRRARSLRLRRPPCRVQCRPCSRRRPLPPQSPPSLPPASPLPCPHCRRPQRPPPCPLFRPLSSPRPCRAQRRRRCHPLCRARRPPVCPAPARPPRRQRVV